MVTVAKTWRSAVGIAAALAVTLALAGPASAIEQSAGGGTWDHGVSASTTWSFYLHPTKYHRSSVTTSKGYSTSSWLPKNVWTFASLRSTQSGNKANYDYR